MSLGRIRDFIIVENVIMERQPHDEITDMLGCRPTLIDARYTCGASRPRLWWTDFEITALMTETLNRHP